MWCTDSPDNVGWDRAFMIALEVIADYLPWRSVVEITDPSNRDTDIVTLRRVMFHMFMMMDATPDILANATGCARRSVIEGALITKTRRNTDKQFDAFFNAFWSRFSKAADAQRGQL